MQAVKRFLYPFRSLAVMALALSLGAPAVYARSGEPPLSYQAKVDPLALVDTIVAPAIDAKGLRLSKALTTEPGPVRFAEAFDTDCTLETYGTWEVLPDGARLWRVRVDAPGATDLNFGFSLFVLPKGATLHVWSEEYDYHEGPYTAADNKPHRQLWTPPVPGSRAVIELYVPADVVGEPEVWLTHINRGFRDFFGLEPQAKQQSCHNDTICSVGDPWRDPIRSVGAYSINGIDACTGTMIRDVPGTFRNFFLTANHCGVNANNDASVVVFWNYESPSCGQLGGGSRAQNQTGATLRASKYDVDFALLELDDTPPLAFNVFYSGWDRTGNAPSSAVGIHHPGVEEKAISFTSVPLTVIRSCTCFLCLGTTHWQVNGWNSGATEGGSSGSGLWHGTTKRLIGTLSGGGSSCSAPQRTDCYGRFSWAWDAGSDVSSRLRDWLDPGNTGVHVVDGIYPTPPPPLPAPTLTSPTGGEQFTGGSIINVTWNRNGAPANSSLVLEYQTCVAPQRWVEVGASAPGATTFAWRVPHIACNGYRIRIKQRATGFTDSVYDTGGTFEILPGPPDALGDFDQDRKWDLAIFELASGNWYILQSASAQLRVQNWGYSATIPVPGDYDGDGLTDIAIFEPTTGNWYILGSKDGFLLRNWGYFATQPVPGDYDADGKTDVAVFEPSTGTWYIRQSSNSGLRLQNWGYHLTVPVPCDYDGDGATDIAVFEKATGTWYILGSASGFNAITLGNAATVPVPCDYDADGKCDVAVFTPATGSWQIRSSRSGAVSVRNWGYSQTGPVPCDFDGDSLCDVAVYERASGNWLINQSTTGFRQRNWGYNGTVPAVPQQLINRIMGLTP